jgi:8-amino-3,8-dideoxy-alpha-D-manno-octulosonate transaminase
MHAKTESLLPREWPGTYMIDEQEMEHVHRVLASRSLFRSYGHDVQGYVEQAEAAYRKRVGRDYALALNSGTGALGVAMSALDIGPGDEVLLPGYFWVSCIAAIVRAGAIPRLVDLDETMCMDPTDLERKIGPHSKLVLFVHMNGAAGRIDEVMEIARRHNLRVLEDVAQANGGSYQGKPLGSFGDAAIFSFQNNKNITSGEGGMFVTDDELLYKRAWAAHDMGYPRDAEGRLVFDEPAAQVWGGGHRMSELTGAVLVVQESKLDQITAAMRRAAQRLYAGLDGIAGAKPRLILDPAGDTGCTVVMTWPDAETCAKMVEATSDAGVRNAGGGGNTVAANWGIHLYYHNVALVEKRPLNSAGRPWSDPLNAFAADYQYGRGTLPQADDLFDRSSILMLAPTMTDETCDRIIEIYRKCAQELGL